MINKRKVLSLLEQYGDAVIEFYKGREPVLCTTDFDNKYIRSIRRTQKFQLKGSILVFNWTDNEFAAIPVKDIRSIIPLSNILGNKKDGI